jgi:hypothetical protein
MDYRRFVLDLDAVDAYQEDRRHRLSPVVHDDWTDEGHPVATSLKEPHGMGVVVWPN